MILEKCLRCGHLQKDGDRFNLRAENIAKTIIEDRNLSEIFEIKVRNNVCRDCRLEIGGHNAELLLLQSGVNK